MILATETQTHAESAESTQAQMHTKFQCLPRVSNHADAIHVSFLKEKAIQNLQETRMAGVNWSSRHHRDHVSAFSSARPPSAPFKWRLQIYKWLLHIKC